MNKKELYKSELENHVTFDYFDYLTDDDKKSLKGFQDNLLNDGSSFYLDGTNKKAIVSWINGTAFLISYKTMVCSIDNGSFKKHWSGYSTTTMKHINIFRQKCGLYPLSKHDWIMMPIG